MLGSIAIWAVGLTALAVVDGLAPMTALLVLLSGCAVAIWVLMVELSRDLLPGRHLGKALGVMSSGTS